MYKFYLGFLQHFVSIVWIEIYGTFVQNIEEGKENLQNLRNLLG